MLFRNTVVAFLKVHHQMPQVSPRKRRKADDELVNDNPKGPDVHESSVHVILHDLRSHTQGSPDHRFRQNSVLKSLREAKVAYDDLNAIFIRVELGNVVIASQPWPFKVWEVHINVVDLQVSVDNLLPVEVIKSFGELLRNDPCELLSELPAFKLQQSSEVSSVVQFNKEVDGRLGLLAVDELENVLVADLHCDRDLLVDELIGLLSVWNFN